MAATAYAQHMGRPRQAELTQKHIRHLVVIMLTGVDDGDVDLLVDAAQGVPQRCDFHEIRSRAGDEVNERAFWLASCRRRCGRCFRY